MTSAAWWEHARKCSGSGGYYRVSAMRVAVGAETIGLRNTAKRFGTLSDQAPSHGGTVATTEVP